MVTTHGAAFTDAVGHFRFHLRDVEGRSDFTGEQPPDTYTTNKIDTTDKQTCKQTDEPTDRALA